MSCADPGLVVEVVRRDPDGCVLAVSGELSLPSPGLLTRSLSKALADPGRVLVNVSGLRLGSAAAAQVFPSALARGRWLAGRATRAVRRRRGPGQDVDRVADDLDGAAGGGRD